MIGTLPSNLRPAKKYQLTNLFRQSRKKILRANGEIHPAELTDPLANQAGRDYLKLAQLKI